MAVTAVENVSTLIQFRGKFKLTISGYQNQNINEVDTNSTGYSTESFTTGTGANQINDCYDAVLTITASGTNNLDLAGSLTNLNNQTSRVFTTIKAIRLRLVPSGETVNGVAGTAATSITIGNGTNPWVGGPLTGSNVLKIVNGAEFAYVDPSATGMTVTASTGDILKILNDDGSASAIVHVTIFGCTS